MSDLSQRHRTEIVLGLFMMMMSWIVIFLLVIEVYYLPPVETILVSIICYAVSVMGLALTTHGYFTALALKKRRKEKLESE